MVSWQMEYAESGSDEQGVDEAVSYLRDELEQLDFDVLKRVSTESAPHGSRAGDAALLISVLGAAGSTVVLQGSIDIIKSWLMRRSRGTVTIKLGNDELHLSSTSSGDQEALVKSFLLRHSQDSNDQA